MARRGGSKLVNLAIDKTIPAKTKAKAKVSAEAEHHPEDKDRIGSSLINGLAGAAILRIALGSVPGAIIVSGGLLAKTLYDRKKARQAAEPKPEKPPKS